MAYVTPTTRADGYVVDASEWNKNTVDNPIALKALVDALAISKDTACGRLTLTSGTPVTTADVTAATTLYYALYGGNQIALYTGSAWQLFTIAELSIAVPATTNTMYDVFVDYNSGTPALAVTAWTNDTTRATALTKQDGVYVLTGSTGKRYVGSFRTTAASGQTEDSVTKRFVWNYYNRQQRPLQRFESTSSWTYTTATWRQANNSASNQVDVVIGVSEVPVELQVLSVAGNTNAGVLLGTAVGLDSTSSPASNQLNNFGETFIATAAVTPNARYTGFPGVGRHYFAWLERSNPVGTTTWYGNGGFTITQSEQSGLIGAVMG